MSGHRGQRGQEGALLAGGRPGPLEEDSGDLGVRERQWLQGHHAVGRPSTCGPGCAVSDSQKRWPLSADRRRRRVVCYLFPPSAHLAYVAACCGSDSDSPPWTGWTSASRARRWERRRSSSPRPAQASWSAGPLGRAVRDADSVSGLDCWARGLLVRGVVLTGDQGLPSCAPFRPRFALRRRLHESAQLSSRCINPQSQQPGAIKAVPHAHVERALPAAGPRQLSSDGSSCPPTGRCVPPGDGQSPCERSLPLPWPSGRPGPGPAHALRSRGLGLCRTLLGGRTSEGSTSVGPATLPDST